ncbi:alanine dehydrogenase [Gordonia sp. CPCC 205333]|uniref:alanine dehydrogenase n=1 Tax=Gordonia sp. CPCC 205333 TaxID=3140790 RepID=UPI003AF3F0F3
MIIGVPKEVKNNEYRVALTPAGAAELVHRGHEVIVEHGAGVGSATDDNDFKAAGAQILGTATAVWEQAEMILKVKEPIEQEYDLMRLGAHGADGTKGGQVLFTYLHLAASRACTDALLAAGTTSIAYETVQQGDGSLPLLAPMSEVAGRLAPQVGAVALMNSSGGRGVLLGGVPGTHPAEVVIIGGGVSGVNAATIAQGMGAHVTVFDLDIDKLRAIDSRFGGRVATRYSTTLDLHSAIRTADLVIGAVLIPGAKAPTLVPNSLVAQMKSGSVLVDIAIDQGGCFEDSRPTTHDDPTFKVHDSIFYCVANMPGSVARTSTMALTNATLPYVIMLAEHGWRSALRSNTALAKGLSTHSGELLSANVSQALGIALGTVAS